MANPGGPRIFKGFIMNSCIAKTDKETYDDQDQFEFLTAARKWQLLKGEWEPLKILGAGTYGVVLKFKYTGSSKFMETTTFFNYSHERLLLRRRKRSIANLSFCYRSTNAKVHVCQTNTRRRGRFRETGIAPFATAYSNQDRAYS